MLNLTLSSGSTLCRRSTQGSHSLLAMLQEASPFRHDQRFPGSRSEGFVVDSPDRA